MLRSAASRTSCYDSPRLLNCASIAKVSLHGSHVNSTSQPSERYFAPPRPVVRFWQQLQTQNPNARAPLNVPARWDRSSLLSPFIGRPRNTQHAHPSAPFACTQSKFLCRAQYNNVRLGEHETARPHPSSPSPSLAFLPLPPVGLVPEGLDEQHRQALPALSYFIHRYCLRRWGNCQRLRWGALLGALFPHTLYHGCHGHLFNFSLFIHIAPTTVSANWGPGSFILAAEPLYRPRFTACLARSITTPLLASSTPTPTCFVKLTKF
jgi:hypothetical protein